MDKKLPVQEKYYLFDCRDFYLGRMCTKIAFLLQGKDKPDYVPNQEGACRIVVINSDKLKVSGKKEDSKMYHTYSGYPGGISSRTLAETIEKDSRKVIWNSVYGMLPKNKLRDIMMKKMLIFKDDKHTLGNIKAEEVKS